MGLFKQKRWALIDENGFIIMTGTKTQIRRHQIRLNGTTKDVYRIEKVDKVHGVE